MPSIMERLGRTLESLAELRIATIVGDNVEFDVSASDGDVKVTPALNATAPGVFTEINLVTGDLITLVNKEFAGEDDPIRALHTQQVENGRKIVADNVRTIRNLADAAGKGLGDILDKDSERTS